jgi:hypothetical protein
MRLHEREPLVREAEHKLLTAMIEATEALTEAEKLRVVNAVCSNWIAGAAKVAIRIERHGDMSTPGGLASDRLPELPSFGACPEEEDKSR